MDSTSIELIGRLIDRQVPFVLVGGMAAVFHGADVVTQDVDVVVKLCDREASRRLLEAIGSLDPQWRAHPKALRLTNDADELTRFHTLLLDTHLGKLDVLDRIDGVGDFDAVLAASEMVSFEGRTLRVLKLDALIASKRAAGRVKDRIAVRELERIRRHCRPEVSPDAQTEVDLSLSHFAVHTMTNKPWSLARCCEAYAQAGFGGISVWRNVIESIGIDEAAKIVRGSGLRVPALVRGGFFPALDSAARDKAIEENKRCIDEAAALAAEMVVLVVGAVVGMPLEEARRQVAEGISRCIDHAEKSRVKLAIEPLHPMYAADRSCINRMKEARLVCEQLRSPWLGIACDVYHVWWDPDLADEIALAGAQGTLFGFHVCDWRPNTRDLLNDRGLMGEGCIDIKTIRSWVELAGFKGLNEVEIFSTERWAMDQDDYLRQIADACIRHV